MQYHRCHFDGEFDLDHETFQEMGRKDRSSLRTSLDLKIINLDDPSETSISKHLKDVARENYVSTSSLQLLQQYSRVETKMLMWGLSKEIFTGILHTANFTCNYRKHTPLCVYVVSVTDRGMGEGESSLCWRVEGGGERDRERERHWERERESNCTIKTREEF